MAKNWGERKPPVLFVSIRHDRVENFSEREEVDHDVGDNLSHKERI